VDDEFLTCALSSPEYAAFNEPRAADIRFFNKGRRSCSPDNTGEASSVTGVAVADLRITDPALTAAQATFRTAGDRLSPVVRALPALDTEVVGADPLAGKLSDAQQLLGADLGIVGQALAELADHASQISAAFTQADQQLGQAAEAVR
jgi:hypothetical protein